MKLQISFDFTDLDKSVEIASKIAHYATIIEVGTVLIFHHGMSAIKRFKTDFPDKIILADTKIVDQGKEIAELCAHAGAQWITVMAGTPPEAIHATTTAAHALNIKVALDLLDANSIGQSALEAKNLGADALIFHQPYNEQDSLMFLDKWDMIKGNTTLPIFVSAKINHTNIDKIITLKPDTIIVDAALASSEDTISQEDYFANLAKKL